MLAQALTENSCAHFALAGAALGICFARFVTPGLGSIYGRFTGR